jgi:predicted histone-like DNA-binding protein
MSIVTNLIDLVPKELSMGRTVNLGKLGTFFLNINSEGSVAQEDVSPDAIKKVNVKFRPSNAIKHLLGRLKFEKLG